MLREKLQRHVIWTLETARKNMLPLSDEGIQNDLLANTNLTSEEIYCVDEDFIRSVPGVRESKLFGKLSVFSLA